MRAETNTPVFRTALSLAAIWVVLVSGYGLLSGEAYRALYLRGAEVGCGHLTEGSDAHTYCVGANMALNSEWELVLRGNPARLTGLYVIGPPLILLVLVAYWGQLRILAGQLMSRYLRWVRGDVSQ